jgi:hypothetical protein
MGKQNVAVAARKVYCISNLRLFWNNGTSDIEYGPADLVDYTKALFVRGDAVPPGETLFWLLGPIGGTVVPTTSWSVTIAANTLQPNTDYTFQIDNPNRTEAGIEFRTTP